jgi:hydrogenase 3 maturation protease
MESPKMSNASWQTGLQQALTQASPPDRSLRVAVVGIGHELRGDDAVGLAVARRLLPPRRMRQPLPGPPTLRRSDASERSEAVGNPGAVGEWLALVGGSAPENCTGTLRRFGPDLVVLVDAADLEARPGTIQWLEPAQIGGLSVSTHTLPLSVLATYLAADLGCEVGILAIQPASNDIGAPLSPELSGAARNLAQVLAAFSRCAPPTPRGNKTRALGLLRPAFVDSDATHPAR